MSCAVASKTFTSFGVMTVVNPLDGRAFLAGPDCPPPDDLRDVFAFLDGAGMELVPEEDEAPEWDDEREETIIYLRKATA